MIRPLRSRHRWMIVGITVVVPTLAVLGLASRRATPADPGLTSVLDATPYRESEVELSQSRQLPGGPGLAIKRLRPALDDGPPRLVVELSSDPHLPELLMYWTATGDSGSDLAADARLLGRLTPSHASLVDLPTEARETAGTLVVYSLSQTEVIDRVRLRLPGEAP